LPRYVRSQLLLFCTLVACDPALHLITSTRNDAESGSDTAPPRNPRLNWTKGYPGVHPLSVATPPDGDLIVVGHFSESVYFGATELVSAGGEDIFVAAFAPSGAPRWAQRFGGIGDDRANGVAVDSQGNITFTGQFSATVDFGVFSLTSAGAYDLFVARINSSGLSWARAIGGSGDDRGYAVALSPLGVLVTGRLYGPLSFGETELSETGTTLLFYNGVGHQQWARRFVSPYDFFLQGLAVNAEGAIALSGSFKDTISLGDTSLSSAGKDDGFLWQIDAQGQTLWGQSFSGPNTINVVDVTFSAEGTLWVAGHFSESMTFGATTLTSQQGRDLFAAQLDAVGDLVQLRSFVGAGLYNHIIDIAVDGQGGAIIGGGFNDQIHFDSHQLIAETTSDMFVTRLDDKEQALWAEHLWSSGSHRLENIAVSADSVYVVGEFRETLTVGETQVKGEVNSAMFIVSLGLL